MELLDKYFGNVSIQCLQHGRVLLPSWNGGICHVACVCALNFPRLFTTPMHNVQVCELDLVFNFNKVYGILDEFICGGELLETSQLVILQRLHDADKLIEKS